MTENEQELISIIRNSTNPNAFEIIARILIDYARETQSSSESQAIEQSQTEATLAQP